MDQPTALLTPTSSKERILALDVIRGFAVLGIFAINILGFAWPVGSVPPDAGGAQGLDLLTFYLHDTLFDGRMRGLFCMLFGAGLVLAWDRARSAGMAGAARMHRRNLLLLFFGLAHVFLLQMPGDILVEYAVCGFLLWGFAGARTRSLFLAAVFLLTISTGTNLAQSFAEEREWRAGLELQERPAASLTEEEIEQQKEWQESAAYHPEIARRETLERIDEQRAATSWIATWKVLLPESLEGTDLRASDIPYYLAILGTMLLGMVLYRTDVLTGRAQTSTYVRLLAAALLAWLGALWLSVDWARSEFSPTEPWLNAHLWTATYEPFRILVGLGWAAALVLSFRALGTSFMHRRLADLGRMALTVYLLETVIATTLFWGWGFGLYGTLSRFELLLVTGAVWLALATFAALWMKSFAYGPAEWLWRRLTYGDAPFRRAAN